MDFSQLGMDRERLEKRLGRSLSEQEEGYFLKLYFQLDGDIGRIHAAFINFTVIEADGVTSQVEEPESIF